MSDKDKFSLKYLIAGDGKKDWYKAIGTGWRLALIAAALFIAVVGVKSLFEKKQVQNVSMGPGSTANFIQKTNKRFAIFIEPYVDQSSNRKFGTGVRAGVRLEW